MTLDPDLNKPLDVDAGLTRSLLRSQQPDLAHLPLEQVARGWDNVMFRLGDDLAVRVPYRPSAASLLLIEQQWLPRIAPLVHLQVPVPVYDGTPTDDYPFAWSVLQWLPGQAWTGPMADSAKATAVAASLAQVMNTLHVPSPDDAPVNPFRGVPLRHRHEIILERAAGFDESIGTAVAETWNQLVDTPAWTGPAVWLHGDLHPLNLLHVDDELTALIDWGDMCSGDPASDLTIAWLLFGPQARAIFKDTLSSIHDEDTWERGRGWALSFCSAVLANPGGDGRLDEIAQHGLAQATGQVS